MYKNRTWFYNKPILERKKPIKIFFDIGENNMGITECPFGGCVIKDGAFALTPRVLHTNTKVGSRACSDCTNNRGYTREYVLCNRLVPISILDAETSNKEMVEEYEIFS